MKLRVVIRDEIHVRLNGIRPNDLRKIINDTKMYVKGYRYMASFQTGAWDGKESLVSEDGTTYLYILNDLIPVLIEMGYDIEIDDRRQTVYHPEFIDETLFEEYGYTLRDIQYEGVNKLIEHGQGILNIATGGGKSLSAAAIAKVYEPKYRTIIIVPSENLADQTAEEMSRVGVETGAIHGKITGKRRKDAWNKKHLVCTWQTLNRNRKYLKNYDVVIHDECHQRGDVIESLLTKDLAHAPIRVGLTGTVPKDKYQRTKLFCHIGGDVIYEAKGKVLMDKGHISTVNIHVHKIVHDVVKEFNEQLLDWDTEFKYLMTNQDRAEAIKEFICRLPKQNTLILCHARFGRMLSKIMEVDFIDQTVDADVRKGYYDQYDKNYDYMLVASFGTVGTGVSINDIYQLVMIDTGKDEVKAIQGIGRGLRKDREGRNHIEVYDLYSDIKYSNRHARDRIRTYKREQYPHQRASDIKVR